MGKNYHEVVVDGSHIKVEKMTANGHEFQVFLEYLSGASEWYSGIVGALPAYLETEHKKPMLLARGPSEDECRKNTATFLEATFPAWDEKKRAAYEAEVEAAEKAAQEAEAEKKKAAAAAKKSA